MYRIPEAKQLIKEAESIERRVDGESFDGVSGIYEVAVAILKVGAALVSKIDDLQAHLDSTRD